MSENDSWQRRHREGGATALAIWLNGRCQASVSETAGLLRAPERVACETTNDAKGRADEMLKHAYPHDCEARGCEAWTPFVHTPQACGC